MNLKSLFWPQTIFSTTSFFNRKIEVKEFLGKRFLRVDNVTQSGGIVEAIYKKTIKDIKPKNIKNILILGFGAGSFAKLINKKFPSAKILGVEIDKAVINVARNYFAIEKTSNLRLIISDAARFIKKNTQKFDLIFVDLYQGEKISPMVKNKDFLLGIKKSLNVKGTVLFNLINFKKYEEHNKNFLKNLHLLFPLLTTKRVHSNLIVYAAV